MEKIYMEENQQKQQKNNQFGFSIVLSFAVAIFAMFSLLSFGLAVYGNNGGVSYAAPITTDKFTLTSNYSVWDSNHSYSTASLFYANNDSNIPVFCVQHAVDPDIGSEHTKQEQPIDDYGLLYLLDHSFANGISVTDASGANSKYVEGWVTQVAIWIYLNEKNPSDSKHAITENQLRDYKAATKLYLVPDDSASDTLIYTYTPTASAPTIYDAYIKPLVSAAKNASSVRKLSVSIDSNDPAAVSDDKSFYRSPLVTVSGDGLVNYDVNVTGVEGAYLVDKDGNNIEATNITPGKEFYVIIPANKVGTETIDVRVTAKGHFNSLKGDYFVSSSAGENKQKVVTVTGTTVDVSEGASFQIIPTPPTGMNAAQTIYFIGLIVLLCGVGIVYANAKPVESKQ